MIDDERDYLTALAALLGEWDSEEDERAYASLQESTPEAGPNLSPPEAGKD
jgi:hypothetical protein